ncbi:MAG: transcription-repair coupling factor [Verrucomicrobiales bacterium]
MEELKLRVEQGGALNWEEPEGHVEPFLAAALHQLFPKRTVILVGDSVKKQEGFQQDLETWMESFSADRKHLPTGKTKPLFYPSWEVLPHESKLPHADVVSERLETLVEVRRHNETGIGSVVTTNVMALMQKTFQATDLAKGTKVIRKGEQVIPLDLVEWLEDQGYEPEAQVTQKGEIALRGGILDIFPLPSAWPVRVEFFGDEIDSLRYFDPQTQISRETIEEIILPPAGELAFLKTRVANTQQTHLGTLLEYLPPQSIFLLCSPAKLVEKAETYGSQFEENDPFMVDWSTFLKLAEKQGHIILNLPLKQDPILSGFEADAAESLKLLEREPSAEAQPGQALIASLDHFRPISEKAPELHVADHQRREFFQQLHRWMRQGYAVEVFCNNKGEQDRFHEIWAEHNLDENISGKSPHTHVGSITAGFISDAAKLVVVTDAEIFGRYKVHRPRRMKSPHAAATKSAFEIDFGELNPGDFVVHLQHGIGRYVGLQQMPSGLGQKQSRDIAHEPAPLGPECLVIEYAASEPGQAAPKLYVPITEAHLVSKYVGAGKARPALNSLGGTRWAKTKLQAEEAVRDLASELLSIQAARESLPGYSFGEDTPWQREFESAFIYEETPDQMKAIIAAKKDMESPRPMDRLVCGDVGYGKTEVAIRTAFKSVMGGKQVALLVPTTVLAQQHYNTFCERMADYPVKVEQLSRFRTKGEQRKILQGLAEGAIDIIIGTHRLIQEDVQFKDLGLVIIDEEQRFGVMHKEKFKLLRKMVDVLTLSATPIPRTLYLALTGARDMSTIETPPQDRLPVETVVTQYDERLIKEAVQRELNRGGQVFFLHNRVGDIHSVALRIKDLVPAARIIVGHGQMDADDLEKVMTSFINGEADVLVSTTIIESGIDIPNANTIIIDRADRFGLSDLYQLRGRVGRYKHQAYAYLLLPRHAALLSDVRKRISAIKQYSSLGSGFKIAMRDLEIRGAGNLLGSQQSGHIAAVGFELYCQLLKQSVGALKGEKVKKRIEVQLRLDFLAFNPGEEGSSETEPKPKASREPELQISVPRETATFRNRSKNFALQKEEEKEPLPKTAAYIPLAYVSEPKLRVEMYRKLAQVADKQELDQLKAEIKDRFGKMPPAMELLLQVSELKALASDKLITAIETKGDKLMVSRNNDFVMVGDKFPRLTKRDPKSRLNEIKRFLFAF